MNHKIIQTLIIASLTLGVFCLLTPMSAAEKQPRMDKAISLLEEAKTDKKPVRLLEKAKEHVENAPANKGGRRIAAIKAIDEAIAAANSGSDAGAKIAEAIELLQEGKEKAE